MQTQSRGPSRGQRSVQSWIITHISTTSKDLFSRTDPGWIGSYISVAVSERADQDSGIVEVSWFAYNSRRLMLSRPDHEAGSGPVSSLLAKYNLVTAAKLDHSLGSGPDKAL